MIIDPLPRGRNNLNTAVLFEERAYYKEKAFPSYGAVPIDLWYGKPLYGKVDIYGNPIYLSEPKRKQLDGSKGQFALNFVADAFNDFRRFINNTNLYKNNMFKSMLGAQMKVKTASNSQNDVNNLYHGFFSNLYGTYVNSYLTGRGLLKDVKNYCDFSKHFLNFIDSYNIIFVTKSSFILSPLCPHTSTGLVIEIDSQDRGDDVIKYQKYISNSHFDQYRDLASKFGFYVNKNAPWILIANLASNKMKSYIAKYNSSTPEDNSLFRVFFHHARKYDYLSLQRLMYQSYKSFIASYPTIEHYKSFNGSPTYQATSLGVNYKTVREIVKRQNVPESFDDFLEVYDDDFFIEFYFKLRIREGTEKFTTNRYRVELKQARNLLRHISLTRAILHIDSITGRSNIYERTPNKNDKANYKLKYFNQNTVSGFSSTKKAGIITSGAVGMPGPAPKVDGGGKTVYVYV